MVDIYVCRARVRARAFGGDRRTTRRGVATSPRITSRFPEIENEPQVN